MAHPAVVGRAARDGKIEFGAFQFLGGLTAVRREPAVEDFDHAIFERGGLERAAIEQQAVGCTNALPSTFTGAS